jgi:hypothetical protein
VWYPKHPQLSVRGIPEHQQVFDSRLRRADVYQTPTYGFGCFCLTSPDGTDYTFFIDNVGTLGSTAATWGTAQKTFYLGGYALTTDDSGNIVATATSKSCVSSWKMVSVVDLEYALTMVAGSPSAALVSGQSYGDGTFTLTSPNGTNYVIYVGDDGAMIAAAGTWGPMSHSFFIDSYVITVENDGSLIVALSGEQHLPTYRMVSPGGYEYVWSIDSDYAVVAAREGHFWNTPVTKTVLGYSKNREPYDRDDAVAESDQYVWVEE